MEFSDGDMGEPLPHNDTGDFGYGGMMDYGDDEALVNDNTDDDMGIEEDPEAMPPSNLELAMGYLAGIETTAFGAFFAAYANHEPLGSTPPADTHSEEDSPEDFENNSLAALDAPSTQHGDLRFDQELNLSAYKKAIADAGLELDPNAFAAGLRLVDGQRFAEAVNTLSSGEPSRTLQDGITQIVRSALFTITKRYTLTGAHEDYGTYATPRDPAIALSDAELADPHDNRDSTQLLIHAERIRTALTSVGVDKKIVSAVQRAHTAEVEGMLPHWALAHTWGLFEAPSTNLTQEWAQWGEEFWDRIDTFLADAQFHAPADSRFMHDLATSLDSNIQRLIDSDLQPAEVPRFRASYDDDEDITYVDTDELLPHDPEVAAEINRYEARLRNTQEQLRQIAGRYGAQ